MFIGGEEKRNASKNFFKIDRTFLLKIVKYGEFTL